MPVKFTNKTTQPKGAAPAPAQSIAQKPEAPAAAPTKAKKSRKRITNKGYSEAVYERLFRYVADGEDLTTACRNHQGMPTPSTVRRRLAVDDQLADQFKRANQIRLHGVADELLRLPDEALEGQQKVTTADRIAAAKLKSDNIKWVAQRMLAEYAGDGEGGTVVLNITGAADIPPVSQPASVPATPLLKIVGGTKPVEGDGDA